MSGWRILCRDVVSGKNKFIRNTTLMKRKPTNQGWNKGTDKTMGTQKLPHESKVAFHCLSLPLRRCVACLPALPCHAPRVQPPTAVPSHFIPFHPIPSFNSIRYQLAEHPAHLQLGLLACCSLLEFPFAP